MNKNFKTIAIISSFDPITKEEIKIIKNNKNCFFNFYFLEGEESIENRINMIKIIIDGDNTSFFDYKKSHKFDEDKIYKITNKSKNNLKELKSIKTDPKVVEYILKNRLYFMKKIINFYKPERLEHAISVAILANKIASSNHIKNNGEYFIAGILHDLGKNTNNEDAIKIIDEKFNKFLPLEPWEYHQFVGAYLAEKLFPKVPKNCINAIKFHTTGKSKMTKIEKIIFSADDIEPLRNYDSSYLINACLKNYDFGFRYTLREVIAFNSGNGNKPSKLGNECQKQYID